MNKVIAFLAALSLLSATFIGGALPASAHADLETTNPVDGASLESAPASITLSFNSKILDGTAELAVSNSAEELVAGVIAEIAQTKVTAIWPAELPGDTYKVSYRIVSEDGHPVTGSFSFSYPDSVAASPSESTSESTSASSSVEPEVSTAEAPLAEPTSTTSVTADTGSDSSSSLGWVLGFLAIGLVVAGYFIWRKRSA